MKTTANRVRCMAAWLALVLAFLSVAPAIKAEAASTPEAFIFLKGSSPRKTYTSKKPRYIYVGGKKVNFDYYVEGKTKGVKGTWKSSNTKVATVDKSGIVRAVGNGTATISFTFTYNKKNYSMKTYVVGRTRAEACTVKVVEPEDFDGTMEVGGQIDINRTLTAKAKARAVTPGIKSTYKAYGELYDDEACTVVHDGSVATLGDKFIVTGESDGVVYFKANARNSKTNMDYNVDSNVIKITVGEGKPEEDKPDDPDPELTTGATQTDVDKIKVTSTTDIEKITLKMGNTILAQRQGSPEIATDKKSAIVSIPGNYQTATYTVLINDSTAGAIDVKCETRRIEKIELDSPYAVLDREMATIVNNKTVNPKATVKYRVLDQFGNDVTTNPSYPYTDFYGGGIFRVIGQGVMEFEFPYNPVVGTKYDVVLVHQGSGKTLREQVELAKPAYVEKVSFAGIYRYNSSKADYELMSDGTITNMAEGDADIVAFGGSVNNTKTNGAYYALFKAENQYGGNAANAGVGFTSMVVNMSPGMTNLNLETVDYNGVKQIQSINPISIGNTSYLAYPLKAGAIKEGTAYLTAFAVGSSTNLSVNINVNAKKGIKTFNISAPETLYEGKATYLDYSIVDTYGASVTDYATLVKYSGLNDNGNMAIFPNGSNIINSTGTNSVFAWEKQEDGTAKLRYTPAERQNTGTVSTNAAYTDIIMTMSGTINVKNFNYTVYSKPTPTSLYGVSSDATLGALNGGNYVALRTKDLLVVDQYGAIMTPEMLKASGYSICIENFAPPSGIFDTTGSGINNAVVPFENKTDSMSAETGEGTGIYQPIVRLKTLASGTVTFNISLQNGTQKVTNSNPLTITMKSVGWEELVPSSYKVTALGNLSNRDTKPYSFEVTALTSDGTRILVPTTKCMIYGTGDAGKFITTVSNSSIGSYDVLEPNKVNLGLAGNNKDGLGYAVNSNGYRQATFTYTVVVLDGRGSTITTTVTISDEAERITQLQLSTNGVTKSIPKNKNIWDWLIEENLISAKDQYGREYTLQKSNITDRTNIIRITVGDNTNVKTDMNGTQSAKITDGTGSVTIRVNVNNLDAQTITVNIGN